MNWNIAIEGFLAWYFLQRSRYISKLQEVGHWTVATSTWSGNKIIWNVSCQVEQISSGCNITGVVDLNSTTNESRPVKPSLLLRPFYWLFNPYYARLPYVIEKGQDNDGFYATNGIFRARKYTVVCAPQSTTTISVCAPKKLTNEQKNKANTEVTVPKFYGSGMGYISFLVNMTPFVLAAYAMVFKKPSLKAVLVTSAIAYGLDWIIEGIRRSDLNPVKYPAEFWDAITFRPLAQRTCSSIDRSNAFDQLKPLPNPQRGSGAYQGGGGGQHGGYGSGTGMGMGGGSSHQGSSTRDDSGIEFQDVQQIDSSHGISSSEYPKRGGCKGGYIPNGSYLSVDRLVGLGDKKLTNASGKEYTILPKNESLYFAYEAGNMLVSGNALEPHRIWTSPVMEANKVIDIKEIGKSLQVLAVGQEYYILYAAGGVMIPANELWVATGQNTSMKCDQWLQQQYQQQQYQYQYQDQGHNNRDNNYVNMGSQGGRGAPQGSGGYGYGQEGQGAGGGGYGYRY